MLTCRLCAKTVKSSLNFGEQPMSNRFLETPNSDEFLHPLVLGFCQSCGLTQLVNAASSQEVKSHFDWIRYNEPEAHLDQVAKILESLPGISKDAVFCGISGHEASLLSRLQQLGFAKFWQLSLKQDLNIDDACASVETIQDVLTQTTSKNILTNREQPDVVIARSILEHAAKPLEFLLALKTLGPKYIVVEVPDNTKNFAGGEYSVLWEEHLSYFTPFTLRNCLEAAGLQIIAFYNFPYHLENMLVAICVPENAAKLAICDETLNKEQDLVCHYINQYPLRLQWYQEALSYYRQQGTIALFGASHLACHFINLLQVKSWIDFIIDDHPKKNGMLMPGSQLPIVSSAMLDEENVKLCLLSLSQESEAKVVSQRQHFIEKGGQFASIFATSKMALQMPY